MVTLLASSVHDMKNSVSMLIGGMQKILDETDPATLPIRSDLAQMTYEARRINSNLVQLLTLYKLGQQIYPFDPQHVALAEFLQLISEQNSGLLGSRQVALEVVVSPDLYWYFDEELVSGVIGNAFSNAVRYTRNRVRMSAVEENGQLVISIEDDGRGFPPEMIEQSQTPLQVVNFKTGSTGLGLYFSAAIAQQHRHRGRSGEIKMDNLSQLGGGRFILRLP